MIGNASRDWLMLTCHNMPWFASSCLYKCAYNYKTTVRHAERIIQNSETTASPLKHIVANGICLCENAKKHIRKYRKQKSEKLKPLEKSCQITAETIIRDLFGCIVTVRVTQLRCLFLLPSVSFFRTCLHRRNVRPWAGVFHQQGCWFAYWLGAGPWDGA